MPDEEETCDKSEFWGYVGYGIMSLLICLGIGTCSMLQNADVKINVNQNVELK
jgi:hypothetical protein